MSAAASPPLAAHLRILARSGWGLALTVLGLLHGLPSTAAEPVPMPDFRLLDVNPNSPRLNQAVSPRDYRLQISAYYFGAAG